MPDLWMDVDIALSKVPVNIFPLTDDTDFKSREEGVTFDAAGMDLVWNFVTTGGAYTQTPVVPTNGGSYDWSNQGNAMYAIEIPASGGASINNDTEGFGWFTGYATGVLPWRGPVIGFRAAALNNSLIDGATIDVNTTLIEGVDATNQIRDSVVDDATRIDASALNTLSGHDPGEAIAGATDTMAANITQIGGVVQSLTDFKDFVDAGYDPATHKVQGLVLADGVTGMALEATLTAIKGVGWTNETLHAIKDTIDLIDASGIADAVWNEAMAGHVAAGSAGDYLKVAYALATGRLKIDDATKQLTLYMPDGVTVVATWNLTNSAGVPASTNVFDRQRV